MSVVGYNSEHRLLQRCVRQIKSQLDDYDDRSLRLWWRFQTSRTAGLTASLLASADAEWPEMIAQHRAHRHPWYDQLAQEVSLEEFAAFLFETENSPEFLPMAERALQIQICSEGRAALLRKIAGTRFPVPHEQLRRRLVAALRDRAGAHVPVESFPSLINYIIIYYYGYYCEPWVLVGALYAAELMTYHRMAQMDAGLVRLGLGAAELQFIRIHLACDEEPAQDWAAGVLAPSVRINPTLRILIAEGIAACLETSARYLDDLCIRQIQRAQRECAALGGQISWAGHHR